MASDEEVGRQILSIFMQHKVGTSGVLRRNHFIDVRDADFQRGLNKAVENRWIKIKLRDRYTYELTEAGLAAGLSAGLPIEAGITECRCGGPLRDGLPEVAQQQKRKSNED